MDIIIGVGSPNSSTIILEKINPKKVKSYVEGHNKTDKNDALAIANAAMQIGLKYSKPKSLEQQSLHSLETSRKFLSRSLVSLDQHIRGTLLDYGIANSKGEKGLKASALTAVNGELNLPHKMTNVIIVLWEQYKQLKEELKQLEKDKNELVRQIEPCKRLMAIEGVGEASAFVGLTPKQHSTGGKTVMLGIDKSGGVKNYDPCSF
ncbi:transposase [Vibrio profundum]